MREISGLIACVDRYRDPWFPSGIDISRGGYPLFPHRPRSVEIKNSIVLGAVLHPASSSIGIRDRLQFGAGGGVFRFSL
jgi:hypothetical protein